MKKIILFIPIVFLISCTSSSILDKEFTFKFYENLDYEKLYRSEDLSKDELFLLNYAVIRQRDYFNYSIEGKTYREILALAKGFEQTGLPVEVKLTKNGEQDQIKQQVTPEGAGLVRKGNTKRISKTLNFRCEYENTTNKDVVLLNSSFIVKGPFNDHLTTANFEINCIIPPKKTVFISHSIQGKNIQENILFEGNPYIRRIGVDSLFNQLNIEPSGLSISDDSKYFKDCFFNDNRILPHVLWSYKDNLPEKWKIKGENGQFQLNFGDAHIPDETDEVILHR